MSCRATVVVTDADGGVSPQRLADLAVARLTELEQRWSRFLPTSELTALNDADGEPLVVSADTVELVTRLVQAWHLTDGAFDPTLLGTLVELGYAASRDDATVRTSLHPSVARRGRPEDVLVDPATGVVRLPAGTVLDPGGLGKGLAADIVTAELLAAGATGALVEIGGDLRAAGASPDGDGWLIDVDTATDDQVLLRIADGAVATSTSRLRTWTAGGESRHHLIDPATLRPSTGTAVSCTVVAGSGAWAEAFTKVAFAHEPAAALEQFERRGLAASITVTDGAGGAATGRLTTSPWHDFQR